MHEVVVAPSDRRETRGLYDTAKAGDTPMSHPGLAGRRLLLVEDEPLVGMLIEELLMDEGCTVVGPCATLAEAMVAARDESFDVALLDVNLRGEKIYPVAEIVEARGIPFLLLTGYGPDAIPNDRPHWHACRKPFEVDVLLRLLVERLEA